MAIDFIIANCIATLYTRMIRNFRHKGLERFFDTGTVAGIRPEHARKVHVLLTRLEMASAPEDMNLPGWGFHKMQGTRKDHYAVTVIKNWRITFRFEGGDAIDVRYEDYH
jgi:proteic killer suppression protein